MSSFAACVVFYNPTNTMVRNVLTYATHFSHLYIMDNSTQPIDYSCLNQIKDVTSIIKLKNNPGIAKALKEACNLAIKDKYDFLLTMDQDSFFRECDFKGLFYRLEKKDIARYGQIAIRFWDSYEEEEGEGVFTTSSGTFINLENYKKIKGFDEGLVVDLADIDLGHQFREIGIKAIALNQYKFVHNVGYGCLKVNFLGKTYTCRKYSPYRYYYIIRNDIILKKRYGSNFKPLSGKDEIIAAILSLKPRIKYLKAIFFALIDGKRGKLGKYKPHDRYDRKMSKKYDK